MNNLPQHCLPPFLLTLHDEELTVARGEAIDISDEQNDAGSALLLAMLRPEVFGIPGTPALRILGWPPPARIIFVSAGLPTSGRGIDDRRTNVVEALLPFLKLFQSGECAAEKLQDAWTLMRQRVRFLTQHSRYPVWRLPRPALFAPDRALTL